MENTDSRIKRTLFLAFFIHIGLLIGLTIGWILWPVRYIEPSPSYEQRIQELDNMQESLYNLLNFVQNQRQEILTTEQILTSLKQEKAGIQPIVEMERQQVQAVLELANRRTWQQIMREHAISFLLGVTSSIAANILWGRLIKQRKMPDE